MSTNISTELIFAKLQSEKSTGELAALPASFYADISTFISEMEKSDLTESSAKQLETAKKMTLTLKDRRKQKLLIYLAYDKPLPQPIPDEEEVLYNEIRQILNRSSARSRLSKLKITTTIPEVLTASGEKVGPYKQGDIIEVSDGNDADFIIKNKIGELVN